MLSKFKKLIIVVIFVYLLGGILLFIFQRDFTYYPSPQDFNNCPAFQEAEKITWQNTRMYVKQNSDRWVIVYHGNAGSACDRNYFLKYLNGTDYSYIFVEYAGYSNNKTSPSQMALTKNVADVIDYLKTKHSSKVVVIGESLGSALASYHSTLAQPNKLMLISPFNKLADEAQSHFWFYPVKFMLTDKYPIEEWLNNTDNIVVLHGTNDMVIPITLAKKLFENLSATNKNFVEVPSAGHNDMYNFQLTENTINSFLK